MKGLLEEGSKMMEEEAAEAVMDAALISAAQRVEHYEIAAYGCLVTYAKELGDDASAELLAQTLGEEEETDEELSALAEEINRAAMEVGAE